VPGVKLTALTVNTPVVPDVLRFVTPVPPICGLALVEVMEKTTPRAVMAAPPSLVTLPPSVADVEVMLVTVGVVTVGAVAARIWNAPMSTAPLVARAEPRWSVLIEPMPAPALWAGLLTVMAIVFVGPPLLARAPSCGSVAPITPPVKPPLSLIRLLLPAKVGAAAPPLVLATKSVTVVEPL